MPTEQTPRWIPPTPTTATRPSLVGSAEVVISAAAHFLFALALSVVSIMPVYRIFDYSIGSPVYDLQLAFQSGEFWLTCITPLLAAVAHTVIGFGLRYHVRWVRRGSTVVGLCVAVVGGIWVLLYGAVDLERLPWYYGILIGYFIVIFGLAMLLSRPTARQALGDQ